MAVTDYHGWVQIVEIAVCDCGWESDARSDLDIEDQGAQHQAETGHPFDPEHVSD